LTEWYPNANQPTVSRLEWWNIEVLPGAELQLPGTKGASHYYTARETDAAPLRIRDMNEKMLFYRGVGDFDPDLHPRFTADGAVELEEQPKVPAILFENRGGRVGYRMVTGRRVEAPELTANVPNTKAAIVDSL